MNTFLDTVSPLHHHPRAQDTGRGIVSPIFSDKSPDVQENSVNAMHIVWCTKGLLHPWGEGKQHIRELWKSFPEFLFFFLLRRLRMLLQTLDALYKTIDQDFPRVVSNVHPVNNNK